VIREDSQRGRVGDGRSQFRQRPLPPAQGGKNRPAQFVLKNTRAFPVELFYVYKTIPAKSDLAIE